MPELTANVPRAFPKLPLDLVNFKLPSAKVFPVLYVSVGLIVQKLFVGVSDKASLPSPAVTEKLCGVKSLPFPPLSVPKVSVEKFK